MAAAPTGTSEATLAVLNRHLQAFGSGDVDAILRDYADDAVVFAPNATVRGRDQMRAYFAQVVAMFPAEGTTFALERQDVDGEVAYISWHASTPVVDIPGAGDTFVVRGDKIVAHTIAGHIVPRSA